MLISNPIKNALIIVLHSLLLKLLADPTIIGNNKSGSFILRTFNPTNKSLLNGSHNNSTKKRPDNKSGKYLLYLILFHFCAKSSSNIQFKKRPIKEMLMGNFPKLVLKAKQEINKIYIIL